MNPDLVIFDLDGTLLDTLTDLAEAMNRTLRSYGLPEHPVDAYRGFVGEGAAKLVARALPPAHEDLHEEAVQTFRATYAARCMETTRPYPGVPALLDALADRGVPLAILSNKPEPMTRSLVGDLLGRWPWLEVVGGRPDIPKKPDPTAVPRITEAAGATPSASLLVGDTWVDMAAATAAGVSPVGVLWGFRDRSELLAAGARQLLERPTDLLGVSPAPTTGEPSEPPGHP